MSFGQSFSRMDNFLPQRDSENLKTAWFVRSGVVGPTYGCLAEQSMTRTMV